MRIIVPLVCLAIITTISLVAGMCWQWFLPGSGIVVMTGTFIVLVVMSVVSRHE